MTRSTTLTILKQTMGISVSWFQAFRRSRMVCSLGTAIKDSFTGTSISVDLCLWHHPPSVKPNYQFGVKSSRILRLWGMNQCKKMTNVFLFPCYIYHNTVLIFVHFARTVEWEVSIYLSVPANMCDIVMNTKACVFSKDSFMPL